MTNTLDMIELKSLRGQMLAATPAMGDPRFEEALLLVAEHGPEGAIAYTVNHPADNISLYTLLDQLDIANPMGVLDHQVFHGGPVRPNNGFVIYDHTLGLRDETAVGDGVYLSRSLDSLRMIAEGRGAANYMICLGRAEWTAGQLEAELRENVWLPCPLDTKHIFGDEKEAAWTRALAKQGISQLNFTQTAGHA